MEIPSSSTTSITTEPGWLAQTGTRLITYENFVYPDQIWMLEESSKYPGYYIYNAEHAGYRLAKWAQRDGAVTVYNGQYHDDQLWRLQKEGNYYRIYNKKYRSPKLAKWGKEDYKVIIYDGRNNDDQIVETCSSLQSQCS